jgi:hypothetical protein
MQAREDGIAFHAYSPVGLVGMMAAITVPAFVFFSSSRVEMVRPMGERVAAVPEQPPGSLLGQLENIHVALLFYYLNEGDNYPKDLGVLVSAKMFDSADALVAPGDALPLTTASGFKTSFVYLGPKVGHLKENEGAAVWVYERDGRSSGSRWVLFADGQVRQVPEAEFQKLLSDTMARIK